MESTARIFLFMAYALETYRDYPGELLLSEDDRSCVRGLDGGGLLARIEATVGPWYEDSDSSSSSADVVDPDGSFSFNLSASEVLAVRAIASGCIESLDDEDFLIHFGFNKLLGRNYLKSFDDALEAGKKDEAPQ